MAEEEERTENFDEGLYEDGGDYPSNFTASATSGVMYERGGEEFGEEESLFSHLGETSDDEDQKRAYIAYLALLKQIACQNRVVDEIKNQIKALCCKPCKTRCDMKEIMEMRDHYESENIKLSCLVNQAMKLQNFGSRRRYTDIPIATQLDEDNMDAYKNCFPMKLDSEESSQPPCRPPCGVDDDDDDEDEMSMASACQMMKKMKKVACPEDKKLIKEIAELLMSFKNKNKNKGQETSPCDQPGGSGGRKPCGGQKHGTHSHGNQNGESPLEMLKSKIMSMQNSINRLKKEIKRREKQQGGDVCDEAESVPSCPEAEVPLSCNSKRPTKSDQLDQLKDQYVHLLEQYSRKENQLRGLEERLKGMCGSCGGAGGKMDFKNADEAELRVLRTRVNDLKEEQVEFKCIMKEQAQQLEEYRNKYLVAQQKVEEQCVTLEKLNMNNKRIEKQINTEVKEIRAKFQEKLNELLQFPKLLENEQLKLAETCKENEDLKGKLGLVCKELKALQTQLESNQGKDDCRPQLMKCQLELSEMRSKMEELERQRDLFCERLKTAEDDLDTLRSESAKIIARTKERSEFTKAQMQEQIDRLEKELAQCRASASLSVADREAVIREMQGQLNTLSYSFDAAQKQIKTLRNHIAYVSNENCFPVKC